MPIEMQTVKAHEASKRTKELSQKAFMIYFSKIINAVFCFCPEHLSEDDLENNRLSCAQWYSLVILALERRRQDDQEFRARLSYIVSLKHKQ